MSSSHDHAPSSLAHINKAFGIGVGLNLAYVLLQIIVGLRTNSLSLLSDAGHNFLDVAGLGLTMFGFRLSASKENKNYTYGFKKASILISLLNALILLFSIAFIGYEAVLRLQNPAPISGQTIAWVSFIGIIINGSSAFLFFKDKEKDLNIKSAFLHLFSDALISLGLVIGGIIIHCTNLYWIDPVLSIIICIVIIIGTWSMLNDSLKLALDGVPSNVDLEKIKQSVSQIKGIKDVHHIHVWAISTTQNALTAHISPEEDVDLAQLDCIKQTIKHELEHQNIQHSTLEICLTNCDEEK